MNPENLVYHVTRALAPILLPMIEKLGDLDSSALEPGNEVSNSDISLSD
jgi:hypothetical protein